MSYFFVPLKFPLCCQIGRCLLLSCNFSFFIKLPINIYVCFPHHCRFLSADFSNLMGDIVSQGYSKFSELVNISLKSESNPNPDQSSGQSPNLKPPFALLGQLDSKSEMWIKILASSHGGINCGSSIPSGTVEDIFVVWQTLSLLVRYKWKYSLPSRLRIPPSFGSPDS